MPSDEVFGLFPTPVLRAPRVLPAALVQALVGQLAPMADDPNKASDHLSHTQVLRPDQDPLMAEVASLLLPKVVSMGALLFGQRMGWSIKEIWGNVLDAGGQQVMHNHANSFVSGVVYLTLVHEASQTVFFKSPSAHDFVFKNERDDLLPSPFNVDRWLAPAPAPGDLVLFPSYLLHGVPVNRGQRRITLAFNAIPERLESWGYGIQFSHGSAPRP